LNKYTAKLPKQSTENMSIGEKIDNFFESDIDEDPEFHGIYNF